MPVTACPVTACFVTPSYSRDFERCRLLVESREHCAPDIDHFIVVDPHDMPLFRPLARGRTQVVDSRDLLDSTFHKLPGANGWWLDLRAGPVRGWITQQLRKLAMPRICEHDVLLNIDSDVVFIRPFSLDVMFSGGRLALFEVDYRNPEIIGWADRGAALVGLPPTGETGNHVGMLIPWWRRHVVSLTETVAARAGQDWQRVLARQRSFSEYMLYGVYIRRALGIEAAGHFSDGRMLVQTSWHKPIDTPDGLAGLFATAPPEAVAVMVHSKDGVSPQDYRRHVELAWQSA